MRYLEQEITDGYERFVNTGKGFGVDLSLRWLDRDLDEMETADIRCEIREVGDILKDRLAAILDRDPENPDFADEIADFAADLKESLLDGEPFQQGFWPCEINSRAFAHPLEKATTHRKGDGIFILTESFRRRLGQDFVRMTLVTRDHVKMGFGCAPEEATVILGETLKRLGERSRVRLDGEKIGHFLKTAHGPKVTGQIGDVFVCVDNSAIRFQPKNRMDLFSDDILLYEKADRQVSEAVLDDGDLSMIKKEKDLDLERERAEKIEELKVILAEYEAEKKAFKAGMSM